MVIEKAVADDKDTPAVVAATALEGGFDTAIYAQGKRSKEDGEPVEANPFNPDFPHQFDSWVAGWTAGVAPLVDAPAGTQADEKVYRSKLAKGSKDE